MLRHRFMKKKPSGGSGIVTDGLVFHLDGTDRGDIARHWIDKIGKIDYELIGDTIEKENGVEFKGKANDIGIVYGNDICFKDNGTFEVAFHQLGSPDYYVLFSPSSSENSFSVGPYGKDLIWSTTLKEVYDISNFLPLISPSVVSITNNICFFNKSKVDKSGGNDRWGGDARRSTIGGRTGRNSFTGIIHEIRIYNRQLTESEILQNQQHDIDKYFGGVIN